MRPEIDRSRLIVLNNVSLSTITYYCYVPIVEPFNIAWR
ncbi:hypothetical protein DSUL_160064 [Desulfovibrionales bacterium]